MSATVGEPFGDSPLVMSEPKDDFEHIKKDAHDAVKSSIDDFTTPVKAAPPATPATPQLTGASKVAPSEFTEFITSTIMWESKTRSAFYFLAGLATLYMLSWWTEQGISIMSGVCYLLLVSMSFNFVRSTIFPEQQQRGAYNWSDSCWTRVAADKLSMLVRTLAACHDTYLSGLAAEQTLKVAATVWVLACLGKFLSPLTVLFYIFLFTFTLPVLYSKNQAAVDKGMSDVMASVKKALASLDRRAKAAAVAVSCLLFAIFFTYFDIAAMCFIALVYAKTLLKPSEIDLMSKKMEPMVATATKLAKAGGKRMGDLATKFDLTPTPAKKKQL